MTHAVTCPHCGKRFVPPPPDAPVLSDLAYAILTARGEQAAKWRRGKAVSLRDWARLVHSNHVSVLAAMRELSDYGYVARAPYGAHGRVRYLAIPMRVLPLENAA